MATTVSTPVPKDWMGALEKDNYFGRIIRTLRKGSTKAKDVNRAAMFFPSKMAAGHMEVGKLPFGSDSLQSKEVLESMSRKELQALAKERGITANSKSAVIIGKILEQHPACLNAGDSSEKSEEELR